MPPSGFCSDIPWILWQKLQILRQKLFLDAGGAAEEEFQDEHLFENSEGSALEPPKCGQLPEHSDAQSASAIASRGSVKTSR